jgi:hypothetical protein
LPVLSGCREQNALFVDRAPLFPNGLLCKPNHHFFRSLLGAHLRDSFLIQNISIGFALISCFELTPSEFGQHQKPQSPHRNNIS